MDSTLEENLEQKMKHMEKDLIAVGKEMMASTKERYARHTYVCSTWSLF